MQVLLGLVWGLAGQGSWGYFHVPRELNEAGKQGSGLLLITGAASGDGLAGRQELLGPGPSPGVGRSQHAGERATGTPVLRGTSRGGPDVHVIGEDAKGRGLLGGARRALGWTDALLFPQRVMVQRVLQQHPGPLC